MPKIVEAPKEWENLRRETDPHIRIILFRPAPFKYPLFCVTSTSAHYAQEFMPHLRPLRTRLYMPQIQRRPRQRGAPPKTGVAQRGAKRERHLQFLEGKGVG
eukprot:10992059-Ditylum_brightwellii.AAC.1